MPRSPPCFSKRNKLRGIIGGYKYVVPTAVRNAQVVFLYKDKKTMPKQKKTLGNCVISLHLLCFTQIFADDKIFIFLTGLTR